MEKGFAWLSIISILAMIPIADSQIEESQPIVNLMIDVFGSPVYTEEQLKVEKEGLTNIYNAMQENHQPSTMFLPENAADKVGLYLTQLGLFGDIEFAMAGNNSDEKLSSKSYAEQLSILKSSKDMAGRCHSCGINEKPILGFKPQSFDQNEDTYKALDEMDIQYNAGFQAEVVYAPGHEKDVWPYLVEGHEFYAVPVSTWDVSGKKMVLQDKYFQDSKLSASQWYDALVGKLEDIQGKDEPIVILLTTSVSGSADYLEALKDFLDYAQSKNAVFVNTKQLVDMAKAGVHDASILPEKNESECKSCNKEKSDIKIEEKGAINVALNPPEKNESECTSCNKEENQTDRNQSAPSSITIAI